MHWEMGNDDWMTKSLFLNNDAPLLIADENDIGFDTYKGLAALTLYQRFHKGSGQKPITSNQPGRLFCRQDGVYVATTAAIRSFGNEIGKRFVLKTAPLLLLSPNAKISSGGKAAMIVKKDPVRRNAALDFLLCGTSAKSQAFVVLNTGYMPSNTGALRADIFGNFYRDNPAYHTNVTQIPRARPWLGWPSENAVRISPGVRDEMTALDNHHKAPKTALADMASKVWVLLPKKR